MEFLWNENLNFKIFSKMDKKFGKMDKFKVIYKSKFVTQNQ